MTACSRRLSVLQVLPGLVLKNKREVKKNNPELYRCDIYMYIYGKRIGDKNKMGEHSFTFQHIKINKQ